jgi:hypothetical protein
MKLSPLLLLIPEQNFLIASETLHGSVYLLQGTKKKEQGMMFESILLSGAETFKILVR